MSIFDQNPRRQVSSLEELLNMPLADALAADVSQLKMRDLSQLYDLVESHENRYAPQKLWHDTKSRARWVTAGIEYPIEIQLTRMAEGVWYDQTGAYYTPEEVSDDKIVAEAIGRRRRIFREKLSGTDYLLHRLTEQVKSIVTHQSQGVIRDIECVCQKFQDEMKYRQLFVPTFEMTQGPNGGTHFAFSGPPNTPDYYALKYGIDYQPDLRHFPSFWLDEKAFKPKDKP